MGAPPVLTPQQRADALAKAAASRKRRAEVKSKIKSGDYTIDTVLELAQNDDAVAKMKVIALLESMPGVGKIRAENLMERIGIASSRRLRGLGPNQLSALLSEFSS